MSTKRYKRRKRNLKKLTLAILLFFIIFRGVPKVIDTASNAISAVLNNGSIETAKSHGNITSKELSEGIPLLIQWDKRWRDAAYGNSDIGISGCAPTCLSMVISGLTRNKQITPYKVAKFAERNGYYIEGTGTSWSLMTEGASAFGITGTEIPLNKYTVFSHLENNDPLICSMKPGDFTTAGHFIVLTKTENGQIKVNDPNSRSRSRLWDYETLQKQIKNLWAFSKN